MTKKEIAINIPHKAPKDLQNGYAGLNLPRKQKQEITDSRERAPNSSKENADLVVGPAAFIVKT